MVISSIQAQLEAIKQEHGDLTCYSFFERDRKGNGYYIPIINISLIDPIELEAGECLVICRNEKGVHIC